MVSFLRTQTQTQKNSLTNAPYISEYLCDESPSTPVSFIQQTLIETEIFGSVTALHSEPLNYQENNNHNSAFNSCDMEALCTAF